MPIIRSSYKPPFYFRNGFISTVYSALFRSVRGVEYERERIDLQDGDFLDLDWTYADAKTSKLIILLHGLEGDSRRPYILGAARLFNRNNIDAVAVNFRGCGGEDNRKYRSYHSGDTGDLEQVVDHILNTRTYTEIYIKGFSLGGNVTLKYLGEGRNLPSEIKAAVAVSVPCDLAGSCVELHKFKNVLYHDNFMWHLVRKLKQKQKRFPSDISISEIRKIRTLKDFDNLYTSRAHGFKDADEYYEQSSSRQFLEHISVPTLILNAQNDSFLSHECYPLEAAKLNPHLQLEIPDYGGHVGFWAGQSVYYSEQRSLDFVNAKG